MNAPMPSYVAEHVQIGAGRGGMRPLAQNGRVVVTSESLQLIGRKGKVLDEAPLDEVSVKRGTGLAVGVTWVTIREKRYSLAVGAGGVMLLTGLLRLVRGASGGKRLVAAVDAARSGGAPA